MIMKLLENWCKWGQRGESLEDTVILYTNEGVLEVLEVTSMSIQPTQGVSQGYSRISEWVAVPFKGAF